jgi:MoxR-like ATPase
MNRPAFEPTLDTREAAQQAARFREVFDRLKKEIHKVFVGHDDLVESVLSVLLSDGHVLLEGVPGLGKTLLARTLASALQLQFSRIQFTPDLMPADIVGTMVLHEKEGGGHELRFSEGPLVASFILADEINRATPKTQSALLEAMQERQISVSRRTIRLPEPFIVIATQNPIEQEGTYPLPEAQLDRFLVKLLVGYPTEREYRDILERTTGTAMPTIEPVSCGEEILAMRRIARSVAVSDQVSGYAVRLVMATQPGSAHAPAAVNNAVALGSSPRGAQGLLLMGKVRALLGGRYAVSCQDIRDVALPVLRHRILLSFEGHSERVNPDDLVRAAVGSVSELTG